MWANACVKDTTVPLWRPSFSEGVAVLRGRQLPLPSEGGLTSHRDLLCLSRRHLFAHILKRLLVLWFSSAVVEVCGSCIYWQNKMAAFQVLVIECNLEFTIQCLTQEKYYLCRIAWRLCSFSICPYFRSTPGLSQSLWESHTWIPSYCHGRNFLSQE